METKDEVECAKYEADAEDYMNSPKGKAAFEQPKCLADTVKFMLSADYKERFIGEYWQLKIRYEKLKTFCNNIEAARLFDMPEPPHDIPLETLQGQQNIMGHYLHILEVRAIKEGIKLYE